MREAPNHFTRLPKLRLSINQTTPSQNQTTNLEFTPEPAQAEASGTANKATIYRQPWSPKAAGARIVAGTRSVAKPSDGLTVKVTSNPIQYRSFVRTYMCFRQLTALTIGDSEYSWPGRANGRRLRLLRLDQRYHRKIPEATSQCDRTVH